jgi:glycosyltransferase involved in cell wall biosynthesis
MKILVIPGDDGACSFYRAYSPYWKLVGHEVAFTYDADDPNFKEADALVIPRAHTELSLKVIREFKASGRPVILDFDDNFHAIPWYNPALAVFHPGSENLKNFEEALELATIVTASTQALADAYKERRDDIMVCPNFITNEHFDEVAPKEISGELKREGQVRIGYVGSHTHFGDVALLAEPLTKIAETYQMPRVQYVFFGYPPVLPLQHRVTCEFYPGMGRVAGENVSDFMLRYYKEIKAMDIDVALAPLENSLFNRCKSNIKLLEYGISGVPVVASGVGPYDYYYNNSLHSIATCWDAWVDTLTGLIERAASRAALADSNLAYIREHHTTRASIGAWQKVVDRLTVVA